jgi:hypothetical protein
MGQGFSGSCLCGAVHYQSTSEPQFVAHCHCVDCCKSSGTGHCTHLVIPQDALTVSGALSFYDSPADSGNIVSRGFCPTCGSPIYSTNSGMPGMAFTRASTLDEPEIAAPQMTVYASRTPSWDPIDPNLPFHAGMPEGGPQKVLDDNAGT